MRLVIFTDSNTLVTARLIRATLRAARKGADHSVVGIVTTRPEAFPTGSLTAARALMMRAVLAASNAEIPPRRMLDPILDLRRTSRRYGFPVLVPPTGDPNDAGFVREAIAGLRPDVALSYFCRHRFRRRLRSVFAHAVNFHAGALPDYRGVMVTSFSILAGESRSGLAFHHMTAKIDRGPVLLQDSVPIVDGATLADVSRAKSLRAAAALPRVLGMVANGDPGRPQSGEGNYYSPHDWMAMTHLSNPANATREQILRRIRAFGVLHLTIDGRSHPVTRLRAARQGERLAFRTADDRLLRPDRFRGLPEFVNRFDRRARDVDPDRLSP